ncbi:NAD(P)-dependent oxidoreductase [Actinorhabdospora filicis]|nr:NAD(P)-dependent oxidoreductase [Actinorhabdospora filicis]
MSTTIGLIGTGYMGAGIGRALREGGARVVATVAGRSPRSGHLATAAGIELLPGLDDVLAAAGVVLSIVPPDHAATAAREADAAARRAGASPLYADLNAVAPGTVRAIESLIALDVVDGAISGGPPSAPGGTTVYLSGARAAELAGLPWGGTVVPVVVGPEVGAASAVKMCTASVYKGLGALMANALSTAGHYDVADHVIADLRGGVGDPVRKVAVSAAKAHRFVGEMLEIAATQESAGLSPDLFRAIAGVWRAVDGTELAAGEPEDVPGELDAHRVIRGLRTPRATS